MVAALFIFFLALCFFASTALSIVGLISGSFGSNPGVFQEGNVLLVSIVLGIGSLTMGGLLTQLAFGLFPRKLRAHQGIPD